MKCRTLFIILTIIFVVRAAGETRMMGVTAGGTLEEYAGSKACSICHADKYEQWSKSIHSTFVRYRQDNYGLLPGDWNKNTGVITENDIMLIVGRKYKIAFIDNFGKIYPYEWLLVKRKWRFRETWVNKDYRSHCGPCHTVGLNLNTLLFKELGVGCETCHGAGKKHIEAQSDKKTHIRIPGRTDGNAVLHTCRKCHDAEGNHARPLDDFTGVYHIR